MKTSRWIAFCPGGGEPPPDRDRAEGDAKRIAPAWSYRRLPIPPASRWEPEDSISVDLLVGTAAER